MNKTMDTHACLGPIQFRRRNWRRCLITVFLTTAFAVAARGESPQQRQGSATGEERHSRTGLSGAAGRKAFERYVALLSSKSVEMLDAGDLVKAAGIEHHLASLFDQTLGDDEKWRKVAKRNYYDELDRAGILSSDEQRTYIEAFRQRRDSLQYIQRGEYDRAEDLLRKSLKGLETTVGENHPSVAFVLQQLGLVRFVKEDAVHAKTLFLRSLAIRKTLLGVDHPYYKGTRDWAVRACLTAKDFKHAEPLVRAALRQRRDKSAMQSSAYRRYLLHLSYVMVATDRTIEGEALCLQVLRAIETSDKRGSTGMMLQKGNALRCMALVHVAYEDYKTAESNFKESLSLYETFAPRLDPNTPVVLEQYASLLRKLGRDEEARELEADVAKRRESIRVVNSQGFQRVRRIKGTFYFNVLFRKSLGKRVETGTVLVFRRCGQANQSLPPRPGGRSDSC